MAVFDDKITVCDADTKQSNLLENLSEFNSKARPREKADKSKTLNALETLDSFKGGIFPLKPSLIA